MKTVFLTEFDIRPDTGTDYSDALQCLFDTLSDNTCVQFKKGTYRISKLVTLNGKKNIKLLGNSSTIIAHFDPCGPIAKNSNVFGFTSCDDLEVTGFFFDTDAPMGATGEIVELDKEKGTADLFIYDEFPVTGFEHIMGTNSFDQNGSPDYAIATYHHDLKEQEFTAPDGTVATRLVGMDYDVIGDHLIRLNGICSGDPKLRAKLGQKLNIRYEIYGNSIFDFASCNRVTLKDIIIYAAASFGATVRPRSSDFTFDNFCIRVPEGSKRLKAANADGIHILGLYGTLTLKNCNMEGMGDDTLNIHGIAGGVINLDTAAKTLSMILPFRGKIKKLPELWACPGDIINIYDSNTFLKKGSFKVDTVDLEHNTSYTELEGEISEGDTLANTKYFASVHVDGCTLRNTRARGLLLQTHDILIENSYIYGMSLPAMLFAPDIRVWWEVGPAKNVEIRNNVIEYCAHIHNGANVGSIVFKACHDVGGNDYPAGVHEDIYIHDNLFVDNPNSGIYVSAAKNVNIENNRFKNCCCDPQDADLPHACYDIVTVNCENVTVSGNESNRGQNTLHIDIKE